MKRRGLMAVLERYDNEREEYIRELEEENEKLRAQLLQAVNDGVKSAEQCSGMLFKAILAGAFNDRSTAGR